MRVLLFIESGGAGGAERVIVLLAEALRSKGLEVSVASLRKGWLEAELQRRSIPYTMIATRKGFDPLLPRRIAAHAKSLSADVIHSHLLDSNFYCSIAARLAGLPHVGTEHGDIHHLQPKGYAGLKMKICAKLGTRFTAVSGYTAEKLANHGVPRDRITVVYNPIGADSVRPARSRTEVRNGLGISPETWVWAHVGNLRPVKDQATLIRGYAEYRERNSSDSPLLIIGDGQLRGELEQLARSLGCESQIRFLGHRDDIPDLLAASDGMILSSVSEALPMVVLEAGLCGCTVVGTDVGGLKDLLSAGRGYRFPVGDASKLAETMTMIAAERASARSAAGELQAFVRAKCSPEAVLDELLPLYRR